MIPWAVLPKYMLAVAVDVMAQQIGCPALSGTAAEVAAAKTLCNVMVAPGTNFICPRIGECWMDVLETVARAVWEQEHAG